MPMVRTSGQRLGGRLRGIELGCTLGRWKWAPEKNTKESRLPFGSIFDLHVHVDS